MKKEPPPKGGPGNLACCVAQKLPRRPIMTIRPGS
jgi:hypothetical protein